MVCREIHDKTYRYYCHATFLAVRIKLGRRGLLRLGTIAKRPAFATEVERLLLDCPDQILMEPEHSDYQATLWTTDISVDRRRKLERRVTEVETELE